MQKYLRESLKTGHIICISEGTAEEVIIKKIFNSNKLIFTKDDKLIRDFSRTRKGKTLLKSIYI